MTKKPDISDVIDTKNESLTRMHLQLMDWQLQASVSYLDSTSVLLSISSRKEISVMEYHHGESKNWTWTKKQYPVVVHTSAMEQKSGNKGWTYQFKISDLTPSTVYSFRVRARPNIEICHPTPVYNSPTKYSKKVSFLTKTNLVDSLHNNLRFLVFEPTGSFAEQRLSIIHAAMFAKSNNLILVPPPILTRVSTTGSSSTPLSPYPYPYPYTYFKPNITGSINKHLIGRQKRQTVDFGLIYDLDHFTRTMSALGVTVESLPHSKVLNWVQISLDRDEYWEHNMKKFELYKYDSEIVVDAGPTFRTVMPARCAMHELMWKIDAGLKLTEELSNTVDKISKSLKSQSTNGNGFVSLFLPRSVSGGPEQKSELEAAFKSLSVADDQSVLYVRGHSHNQFVVSSATAVIEAVLSQSEQPQPRASASTVDDRHLDGLEAIQYYVLLQGTQFIGPQSSANSSATSMLLASQFVRGKKKVALGFRDNNELPFNQLLGVYSLYPKCVRANLKKQLEFRHGVQRLTDMVSKDSKDALQEYGELKDNVCHHIKDVFHRLMEYAARGDTPLARATLEHANSALEAAGMEDFVREPRTFVGKVLVAQSSSLAALEMPTLSIIPQCPAAFASQIFVVQKLIFVSVKKLQAGRFEERKQDGVLGASKVLLFSHNLEVHINQTKSFCCMPNLLTWLSD
jgi:hypothetical protein